MGAAGEDGRGLRSLPTDPWAALNDHWKEGEGRGLVSLQDALRPDSFIPQMFTEHVLCLEVDAGTRQGQHTKASALTEMMF